MIGSFKAEKRQSSHLLEHIIARDGKYVMPDIQIRCLVVKFEHSGPVEFFRGIAHNLSLPVQ